MNENRTRTAGPVIPAHSHGIKVNIEESAWKDMFGWCRAANTECSGLGLAKIIDGQFYVSKVFLPEQYCSTGYTLLDKNAQSRLINSLMSRHVAKFDGDLGRMVESGEPTPGELLKFWWHTHHVMNTFWSGTDDDNAQNLAHQMGDWSLSLVINQRGDWLCRADFVAPIPIMVDNLEVNLIRDTMKHSRKNYDKDIARWIKPIPEQKPIVPIANLARFRDMDGYVNYAGILISTSGKKQLTDCPCGDGTCFDCKEVINRGMWSYE